MALVATQANPDPSEHFRFFIGAWEGEGSGRVGSSQVTREYAWVLDGKFIEVRNRSFYRPQEKNRGEDHRDVGYISYDTARRKHVLRQFHVEGFVNQYLHESASADGKTIVFVTETIENIPPDRRARETYILAGADELIERFELAEPGKVIGVCIPSGWWGGSDLDEEKGIAGSVILEAKEPSPAVGAQNGRGVPM